MPTVECPIEGCEYRTPYVDPVVDVALITTHATTHAIPQPVPPVAKVEKVKCPCIWNNRGLAVLQANVGRLCESNKVVGC